MTSLSVGSLLDDNLWHDIYIHRNRKRLAFSVDRVQVNADINTDYEYLNLNREVSFFGFHFVCWSRRLSILLLIVLQIYIGGVPNYNYDGIIVRKNFTGCMENLYLNNTNIIERLKRDDRSFVKTNVILSCIVSTLW